MTATLQLPENLTVKAATIDLTGQKFGKLTALRVVGKAKSNSLIWLCVCECGVEIQKTSALLRKSTPTGCGSCVANARSKAQTARWQREDTWNKGRRYQTIPDNGEFRSRAAWGKALIRKYGNRCQSSKAFGHSMRAEQLLSVYPTWEKNRLKINAWFRHDVSIPVVRVWVFAGAFPSYEMMGSMIHVQRLSQHPNGRDSKCLGCIITNL